MSPRLFPIVFLVSQAALFGAMRADAAPKTKASVAATSASRAVRDERLARAASATFGGVFHVSRQGDALVLDAASDSGPRPRAFPKENTRLLRAFLRAEAETLGGDEGDDYRLQSYFGDPPAEPRYLEASQRLGASEIPGESPLVRAWFDEAGHLVRVRVSGEAMHGMARVARTPRVDEGAAATCALRGSYAKPSEVITKLVVASRAGVPYLAWNVHAPPGAGTFDATVDATTCTVVVHEDKR